MYSRNIYCKVNGCRNRKDRSILKQVSKQELIDKIRLLEPTFESGDFCCNTCSNRSRRKHLMSTPNTDIDQLDQFHQNGIDQNNQPIDQTEKSEISSEEEELD